MLPFRSKKYRISYKNVMKINNKKVIVLYREKFDTNLFVNVPSTTIKQAIHSLL